MNKSFWKNRRVLITGHTGFKGSWLTQWLLELGAHVCGYSLAPQTTPSLFALLSLDQHIHTHILDDICNYKSLFNAFEEFQPEIVFHLAAQSQVLPSYENPLHTIGTNTLGSTHILECVRQHSCVQAAVILTTDKVYRLEKNQKEYRELDPLGSSDPYSTSKAAADLIAQSYIHSFFRDKSTVAIARSGNVIGGGDWMEGRLIPDCALAWSQNSSVTLRNPHSVRPWQHVLDCLHGYLLLAENIFLKKLPPYPAIYNFGPETKNKTVLDVLQELKKSWPEISWATEAQTESPDREANFLSLNSDKAKQDLNWNSALDFETSLLWTSQWYQQIPYSKATALCLEQIHSFDKLLDKLS